MSNSAPRSSGPQRFAYGSAPERRDRIAQYVSDQGYCTIAELSREFGVSEMTIRRDVGLLEVGGRLRGFHGGAGSLSAQDLNGSPYDDRDRVMAAAKHAIALRALEFVHENSVIAIDAGTTAAQFASVLPEALGLRVATHSLSAVTALARKPEVEVNCLGGVLHPESLSFAGPSTLAAISNIQVDTLFLAASGLNDRGTFCGTGFDAITKRALIEVSNRVILLADSSKFMTSAMVKVCEWDSIDTLVIDNDIDPDQVSMLDRAGVEIITVEV
jgi:DeoR family transcriptional regulator of aga operon